MYVDSQKPQIYLAMAVNWSKSSRCSRSLLPSTNSAAASRTGADRSFSFRQYSAAAAPRSNSLIPRSLQCLSNDCNRVYLLNSTGRCFFKDLLRLAHPPQCDRDLWMAPDGSSYYTLPASIWHGRTLQRGQINFNNNITSLYHIVVEVMQVSQAVQSCGRLALVDGAYLLRQPPIKFGWFSQPCD